MHAGPRAREKGGIPRGSRPELSYVHPGTLRLRCGLAGHSATWIAWPGPGEGGRHREHEVELGVSRACTDVLLLCGSVAEARGLHRVGPGRDVRDQVVAVDVGGRRAHG